MPIEQIVAGIIEKSLIGGAFIYMLHYFLTKFAMTLDAIADTLLKISSRLDSMETRIEKLEERRRSRG